MKNPPSKKVSDVQQENLSSPSKSSAQPEMLTFGGHLEVLRRMLFRILGITAGFALLVFCMKDSTFSVLLAPSEYDFVTYRVIEKGVQLVGIDFHFQQFHVNMIATDLSSQFMTHINTAIYLGFLCASPFVVYELSRFIAPALYDNERRYSVVIAVSVYMLFIIGVLVSYFILFPISFRFLGTYSVSERVVSNITLDSYITTFTTLTLVMGLVFQLPVVAYVLGKMKLIQPDSLMHYRKHAFLVILLVGAIITPPDIMTLILVSVPLYVLYELSIRIVKSVSET